ncbi:hypothetical protein MIR68_002039 [Amoeboaphelidium protococcarum]|nr:hypothetical protein MIR68_002039 [Amoeboaphelidium protococcarum]
MMNMFQLYLVALMACCIGTISSQSYVRHNIKDTLGPLLSIQQPLSVKIEPYVHKSTPSLSYGDKLQYFRLIIKLTPTQSFYLHMHPNQNILHPDANAKVYGDNGKVVNVIKMSDVLCNFHGHVLSRDDSDFVMDDDFVDEDGAQDLLSSLSIGDARLTFAPCPRIGSGSGSFINENVVSSVSGSFTYRQDTFTIQSYSHYLASRRSSDVLPDFAADYNGPIIYSMKDFGEPLHKSSHDGSASFGCGSEHLHFNRYNAEDHVRQKLRVQVSDNDYGVHLRKRQSAGCPTNLQVLYLGVAADCSYFNNFNGDSTAVLQQIVSEFNQASALYQQQLNIALGIVETSIQSSCDTSGGKSWNRQCSSNYPLSRRLNDFAQWRGQQKDNYGLWHLKSVCSSCEAGRSCTLGISWLNMVCERQAFSQQVNGENEFVSGVCISTPSPSSWTVVAHEIGHSFGANHDCSSTECSSGIRQGCCPCQDQCDCQGRYLMHPSDSSSTDSFSPCSVSTICQKYPIIATCLQNPNSQKTITEQQCGNGILESGEECDCGTPEGNTCKNSQCCDGATCKLKNGARCEDSNGKCCQNCQLKSQGTQCFSAPDQCSKNQFCDGQSGVCPVVEKLPDRQQCSINATGESGYCASGSCTSRDYQCSLRGETAGITGECRGFKNQCAMFCQNDRGQCFQIAGFFTDGTACGYSGTCKAGQCNQSGWSSFVGWMQDNLAITIVLASVVGLILFCFIWSCIARRKNQVPASQRFNSNGTQSSSGNNNNNNRPRGYNPNYPAGSIQRNQIAPSVQQPSQVTPAQSNWVDPYLYNGPVNPDSLYADQGQQSADLIVDLPPPVPSKRVSSMNVDSQVIAIDPLASKYSQQRQSANQKTPSAVPTSPSKFLDSARSRRSGRVV